MPNYYLAGRAPLRAKFGSVLFVMSPQEERELTKEQLEHSTIIAAINNKELICLDRPAKEPTEPATAEPEVVETEKSIRRRKRGR